MNKNIIPLLLLWLAAGCSSSDDETPVDNMRKPRLLTITETQTRAVLGEADYQLTASWVIGDALTYCNLSYPTYDMGQPPITGQLTATRAASISQFEGTVDCYKGDMLAVVYPSASFGWSGTDAQYTITLSGQDGLLQTLAERYHYVYGVAEITSVTDNTAQAEMVKMKSLLAVCKFSFVDQDSGNTLSVRSLEVSFGEDGTDGYRDTYPQTATVVAASSQASVAATAVSSDVPLTVDCAGEGQTEVYVALLPTTGSGSRTFQFKVTDISGSTYTGTAKASLSNGEYVAATGLKVKNSSFACFEGEEDQPRRGVRTQVGAKAPSRKHPTSSRNPEGVTDLPRSVVPSALSLPLASFIGGYPPACSLATPSGFSLRKLNKESKE